MRKLDILIPQYKETDEIIKPLLDSIKHQYNVDFKSIGVIIANDGTDVKLSQELLSSYPFEIEYIQCKHGGVGITRNNALKRSKAEWVMFCDADDMFFSTIGLGMMMNELDEDTKGLVTNFIEECKYPDGTFIYTPHENDGTFVHGKIWRRKFLVDNKIKFYPGLHNHEDSYFNQLAIHVGKGKLKYMPTASYLWKNREDSVCRSDKFHIIKTFKDMIRSQTLLCRELQKRNIDNTRAVVFAYLYDFAIINYREYQIKELKKYVKGDIKAFKRFYEEFKDVWDKSTNEQRKVGIEQLKQFDCLSHVRDITFSQFIESLKEY